METELNLRSYSKFDRMHLRCELKHAWTTKIRERRNATTDTNGENARLENRENMTQNFEGEKWGTHEQNSAVRNVGEK